VIDGKLRGVAVHIGARVAEHAAPGEVLVSRTLRDLVTGSGITFESRGPADLGYPRRVGALRRDRAVARLTVREATERPNQRPSWVGLEPPHQASQRHSWMRSPSSSGTRP
jgi:class 3 adenylate cyclase